MNEDGPKLPAFGLAEDMIAQLEEMLSKKKRPQEEGEEEPAPEPPRTTSSALPAATPVDPQSPTRILDFASLLEDTAQRASEKQREREIQLVSFWLGQEEFSIGINYVKEIIRVGAITRIPEAPEHVRGVTNLRGRIIPVVELRTRLGMPTTPNTRESRIIVVEAYQRTIGLLVDRVAQIIKTGESTLSEPPEEVLPPLSDYLSAVVQYEERLILLLDAQKVLLLPGRQAS